jgi:hypothetical protein
MQIWLSRVYEKLEDKVTTVWLGVVCTLQLTSALPGSHALKFPAWFLWTSELANPALEDPMSSMLVAYTCNPSYLKGKIRRIKV